jgi:hypothetical protein
MHYKRGEAVGAAAPANVASTRRQETKPFVAAPRAHDDIEAFWEAISLQAAARAATFATGSAAFPQSRTGAPQGSEQLDWEEHVSPGHSLKLVLVLVIGVAVIACVTYFMMGGNLLLRLPSPA